MLRLFPLIVLCISFQFELINGFTSVPLSQVQDLNRRPSLSLYISTGSSSNNKLSKRAARKKAERVEKKTQRGQNSEHSGNRTKLNQDKNGVNGKVYSLHSTAVSALTTSSTAQDVTRAIKRAQVCNKMMRFRTFLYIS